MDGTQTLINVAMSIILLLGGWVLRSLQSSHERLQKADADLASKIQSIEVLVAGNYVKRDDLEKNITAIFAKLDRIETKLDHKVDK